MQLRAIPFGTSAGRPTLMRGASALAVQAERGWVLCDCGEGAQLAMQRAGLSMMRLEAVLITHLHGDHLNGLPGVLGTLSLEGRERPILVTGPPGIRDFLETMLRLGALGVRFPVIVMELSGPGGVIELPEETDPSFEVRCAPLSHRVPCYGYRVSLPDRPGGLNLEAALAAGVPQGPLLGQLKDGKSVQLPDGRIVKPDGLIGPPRRGLSMAYTLDTVPCDNAVELGRGVDLLVHEATYEHARAELARTRGHSSGIQAAEIGARADARRVLLTHFSPSVDGERVADEARPIHANTLAAADGVPLEFS
jgi:ribonuclease Z